MPLENDLKNLTDKIKGLLKVPTEQEKRQVLILSSFLEELKRPLYQIVENLKVLQPVQETGLVPSVREYNITLSSAGGFLAPYLLKQSIGASKIEIMNVVFTGSINNLYIRFEEPKDDTPILEWFKIAISDGSRDDFPRKFSAQIGDLWFNCDGLGTGTVSFTLLVYRNLENLLVEPLAIEDGGASITIDGTVAVSGAVSLAIPVDVIDGTKTVAASATPEALPANACKYAEVQALSTNTNPVFVGDSGSQNFRLQPTDSVGLEINNTSKVFIRVTTNGEGVNFLAVN